MQLFALANGEIGKDNDLIWKLKADMKYFKETTSNGIVIMGRKTWDSLPPKFRPLPNRINIVVSHSIGDKCSSFMGGAVFCKCKSKVLEFIQTQDQSKPIFVMGGAQIYKMFEPEIQTLYATGVHDTCYEVDTKFPINLSNWSYAAGKLQEENGIKFQFDVYTKMNEL